MLGRGSGASELAGQKIEALFQSELAEPGNLLSRLRMHLQQVKQLDAEVLPRAHQFLGLALARI